MYSNELSFLELVNGDTYSFGKSCFSTDLSNDHICSKRKLVIDFYKNAIKIRFDSALLSQDQNNELFFISFIRDATISSFKLIS